MKVMDMYSVTNRALLKELPFGTLTDYDIEVNFLGAKERILNLMDQHQLKEFIRENCFRELFNPEDIRGGSRKLSLISLY